MSDQSDEPPPPPSDAEGGEAGTQEERAPEPPVDEDPEGSGGSAESAGESDSDGSAEPAGEGDTGGAPEHAGDSDTSGTPEPAGDSNTSGTPEPAGDNDDPDSPGEAEGADELAPEPGDEAIAPAVDDPAAGSAGEEPAPSADAVAEPATETDGASPGDDDAEVAPDPDEGDSALAVAEDTRPVAEDTVPLAEAEEVVEDRSGDGDPAAQEEFAPVPPEENETAEGPHGQLMLFDLEPAGAGAGDGADQAGERPELAYPQEYDRHGDVVIPADQDKKAPFQVGADAQDMQDDLASARAHLVDLRDRAVDDAADFAKTTFDLDPEDLWSASYKQTLADLRAGGEDPRDIAELQRLVKDRNEKMNLVNDPALVVMTTGEIPRSAARTPETKAFIRDAFAEVVAQVGAVLGEPVYRRPGAVPAVRWNVPAGAVRVLPSSVSVQLVFYTPAAIEADEHEEAADERAGDGE